jgi:prefoldin subunit 5
LSQAKKSIDEAKKGLKTRVKEFEKNSLANIKALEQYVKDVEKELKA